MSERETTHEVFDALLDEYLDQLREPSFYENYEERVKRWRLRYLQAAGVQAAEVDVGADDNRMP